MKEKKTKQYCTNKELVCELVKYEETGIISEELGTMFLKIATKFTNRSNWVRYSSAVKEDFIGEAVLRMVSQVHKFNLHRKDDDGKPITPNPFSYFTQICFHKYIMEARKYYKQINIQRDLCEMYIEEIECNEHIADGNLKRLLKERVDELD